MPNFLKNPRWSKVDMVDRGADQHSRFSIWKRDDSEDVEKAQPTASMVDQGGESAEDEDEKKKKKKKEEDPEVTKREFSADKRRELAEKGQALPDGSFPIVNKSDLSNAIQAFGRAGDKEKAKRHIIKRAKALGAAEMLPDDWQVSKSDNQEEEGAMPRTLSEEVRKGLSDEAREYLEELEAEVAKNAETPPSGKEDDPDPQDITKRDDIPEDIKKMFSDQAEAVAKAESIAKEERDRRLTREWEERLAGLNELGIEKSSAKDFKELAEVNPDLAENITKSLEALAQRSEMATLFEEIGKGDAHAATAEGQLEQVVKSIAKEEKVSEPEAWDLAIQRDPDLYDRYTQEVGR